jgi:hypothetical protein
MSTKLREGEEREEMLLKFSRSTLELDLSLEWSAFHIMKFLKSTTC